MKKVFIITGIVIMAIIAALVCANDVNGRGTKACHKVVHSDHMSFIEDMCIMDEFVKREYGSGYYGYPIPEKDLDKITFEVIYFDEEGKHYVPYVTTIDKSYYRYQYFGE